MTKKIKMVELRERLQNNSMSVSMLREKVGGSNKDLVKFLDWIGEGDLSDDHWYVPTLLQGITESDTYQGQPMVWDGSFTLKNGKLTYEGWAGASGYGGHAERRVKDRDRIMVH